MPATTPVRTGSTPASPSLLQWVGFEARPGTVDGFARGFSMSRETSSRLVEEFVRPRHRDDPLDTLRRHRTPRSTYTRQRTYGRADQSPGGRSVITRSFLPDDLTACPSLWRTLSIACGPAIDDGTPGQHRYGGR